MINILDKTLTFLLSSALLVVLLYFKVKIIILQQILLVLIVALLFILNSQKYFKYNAVIRNWILIFIITFFIQLLLASTGAIFSPFFVLIHLYIIGLALYFNFWTALSFLVMEIVVIFLNINLDQNLFNLVRQDFGSVLLYFASILVITPVTNLLAQKYNIKSDVLKNLFRQLSSQETILEQIDDFVFTTDTSLIVLNANDAAKKIINIKEDNKTITDLINLIDETGKTLTTQKLLNSLETITKRKYLKKEQKINLILKGYTLKILNKKESLKVTIRVTPVYNPNNTLEEFIFLISTTMADDSLNESETKLRNAHKKYLSTLKTLKSDPTISNLDMLDKYGSDILTASELTLSSGFSKTELTDIFRIFIQVYEHNLNQAKKLDVEYKLNLPDDLQQEYRLSIANTTIPKELIELSSVSAVTNPGLLEILIGKTIDIVTGIALAGKEKSGTDPEKPQIELNLLKSEKDIKLTIGTRLNSKQKEDVNQLLGVNKGKLEILDNLLLSSGLESYLIKNIIDLLGFTFTADFNKYNSKLSLTITIDKFFQQSAANKLSI